MISPEVQAERDRCVRLLTWRRACHQMWAADPSCKMVAAYLDTIQQLGAAIADISEGKPVPASTDDQAAYARAPEPKIGGPVQLGARDRYSTDQDFRDQVDALFKDSMRSLFGPHGREKLAEQLAQAFREAFTRVAAPVPPEPAESDEPKQKGLF